MPKIKLPLMIAWLLLQPCFSMAQNLVKNYSFEDTIACPVNSGELEKAEHWFHPNAATSDYFNACSQFPGVDVPNNFFGYQSARTGVAYAGIATTGLPMPGYREHAAGVLVTPLVASRDYCTEFHISLANEARYATDLIGVHFFLDSLVNMPWDTAVGLLQVNNSSGNIISDTAGWTKIFGIYTATGGEKFVVIGNFYPADSLTIDTVNPGGGQPYAYYYLDDVYVRLMDSVPAALHAGNDTTVCMGDSAALGAPPQSGYTHSWQGPGVSNATASQLTVAPLQTSTYILTITDTMPKVYSCQPTKTDTVRVTVIDCDTLPEPGNVAWLPNIFSPNGDGNNDVLYVRGNNIEELTFTIYNRWGEQIFQSDSQQDGWTGEGTGSGVYVYYASGTFTDGEPFTLKGNVSLVR